MTRPFFAEIKTSPLKKRKDANGSDSRKKASTRCYSGVCMSNHGTAVAELTKAISERVDQIQLLTVVSGTPSEHEERFFKAERIRDEIGQLQKAIDILEKHEG